ncbi:MAG: sulfatase-like hydrolase/transferase, partial [Muribaculaceae bacterium]|nr:sulfatase-like hydrolase/transferase [Muribaculaceae bacterium]
YMKGGGKALWKDENIADSITAHAVKFIEQHVSEPFFLYLATNDVHVPRFPHPRHRGKSSMGLRGDAIAQFDATVETVLNTLDSLSIADNTLVILSSDNGPVVDDGYLDDAEELLGGHSPTGNLRGGKYSAFEGGTRVPMIVRWRTKIPAGQTSDALVSQIDWLKSLAALSGARIPENAAIDSRDNLASIIGEDKAGRDYVIEQASNHALSVRTKEWKYIEPSEGKPIVAWGPKIETGYLQSPQLYDMQTDSLETMNVANNHPELVEYFSQILSSERNLTK